MPKKSTAVSDSEPDVELQTQSESEVEVTPKKTTKKSPAKPPKKTKKVESDSESEAEKKTKKKTKKFASDSESEAEEKPKKTTKKTSKKKDDVVEEEDQTHEQIMKSIHDKFREVSKNKDVPTELRKELREYCTELKKYSTKLKPLFKLEEKAKARKEKSKGNPSAVMKMMKVTTPEMKDFVENFHTLNHSKQSKREGVIYPDLQYDDDGDLLCSRPVMQQIIWSYIEKMELKNTEEGKKTTINLDKTLRELFDSPANHANYYRASTKAVGPHYEVDVDNFKNQDVMVAITAHHTIPHED